ncbi:MAG: hypothetical protein IJO47_00275 [Clostridia bacterium]|nr:hypothetical protein [Clostridia bacterium]
MRKISYNVVRQSAKYWNYMLLSLLGVFFTGNFFFMPVGVAVFFLFRYLIYTDKNLKCPVCEKYINIRALDHSVLKGYIYYCPECRTGIIIEDLPAPKQK